MSPTSHAGFAAAPVVARTRRRGAGPIAVTALVSVLGVLAVRVTIAEPLRVSSASMEPTFAAGDIVLVSRSAPPVAELRHDDLVVFRDPAGESTLKRVVGLPGEEVVILDGVLHVEGRPVREPWVDHDAIDGYYSRTFLVPRDHVFVMGDNRGNSVDSRDYGAVSAEDLAGRVIDRLWPVLPRDGGAVRPTGS